LLRNAGRYKTDKPAEKNVITPEKKEKRASLEKQRAEGNKNETGAERKKTEANDQELTQELAIKKHL
jgi:hypothetical protein